MSDLVKRLRYGVDFDPAGSEIVYASMAMTEAADRLEALEAALRQAREALVRAEKHHTATSLPLVIERFGSRDDAQAFGRNTWHVYVPQAIDAINILLKD